MELPFEDELIVRNSDQPAFLTGLGMPGNANLPIGDLQYANREIGVPRFQTLQCVSSVHCDWEAIPVESP